VRVKYMTTRRQLGGLSKSSGMQRRTGCSCLAPQIPIGRICTTATALL
jgi:hypothetical protein